MAIRFHRWMDSVAITLLECGAGDIAIDGYVNAKTVPYAILGEATSGHYEFTRDGRTTIAPSGSVIFAPPQTAVRLVHHHDPGIGTMTYRFIHARFVIWGGVDLFQLIHPPDVIIGPVVGRLGEAMDELLEQAERSGDAMAALAQRQEIGFRVLGLLTEVSAPRPNAEQLIAGSPPLHPLLRTLHESFGEPWNVDRMTTIARVSRAHLYRQFVEAFGSAPMHYLKRLRLDEAASRLLATSRSVGEIATEVGFADIYHFSREFARRYGAPPSIYRRDRIFGDLDQSSGAAPSSTRAR